MNNKNKIFNFIRKQKLAVISTISKDHLPESAVLEFGETEDLELIIDTFNYSRKYKNLQGNPNVSFVIGWDENITVQYAGIAKELKGKKAKKYQEIYWQKNPKAKRWLTREGITYFRVTPKWIRYSDLNKDPWEVFEIHINK